MQRHEAEGHEEWFPVIRKVAVSRMEKPGWRSELQPGRFESTPSHSNGKDRHWQNYHTGTRPAILKSNRSKYSNLTCR